VSPLRGENPQNRPLSKLNNRHFALRAVLPVNNIPESQASSDTAGFIRLLVKITIIAAL